MYFNIHSLITEIVSILPSVSLQREHLVEHLPVDNHFKYHLLAIGKAAWQMADTTCNYLLEHGIEPSDGYVLTINNHSQGQLNHLKIMQAGHPYPDANSFAATDEILTWLQTLDDGDELIVLLSGGGSSLFEKPLPQFTEAQVIQENVRLVKSGLPIEKINRKRSEMSGVKGGKTLSYIKCKHITIFTISDVKGDDPYTIASAPFTALPDAQLNNSYVDYHIVANNRLLCESIANLMDKSGFNAYLMDGFIEDEARHFGKEIAKIAHLIKSGDSRYKTPCAIIMGGESLVNVTGSGRGGRCLETCFSGGIELSGLDNTFLICLASDGKDGNSNSAGAYVDGQFFQELRDLTIDINSILLTNNTLDAFSKTDRLINTGLTGTNVNDIYILLSL